MNLDQVFEKANFKPNKFQREAIEYNEGPLWLVAGPGSGKTRVLLWKTLNLIVFENIKPEEIFLSTFTEKAAEQLKSGLLNLLGIVTQETGIHYDISKMYIGTVHSLCQKLSTDRRFSKGAKKRAPIVMDELDQYFMLYDNRFWNEVETELNLGEGYREVINKYLGSFGSGKHNLVTSCISIFNRFSEECIEAEDILNSNADDTLKMISRIYDLYKGSLSAGKKRIVDFSLLQQCGYEILSENPEATKVFKYVIIDEYQDTNSIQEKIFFKLSEGYKNICVVGDDDQSLYRFRGATVENFVQFKDRCKKYHGLYPKEIKLSINYRSRKRIVDFYSDFIQGIDWGNHNRPGHYYRIKDKDIAANSTDEGMSVVKTPCDKPENVYAELANHLKELIDEKVVSDPNQIAVLFTYLKGNKNVQRLRDALNDIGIMVYAPRAGRFLDNAEPMDIIGLIICIFGMPEVDEQYNFGSNAEFNGWLCECEAKANELVKNDKYLKAFIEEKRKETEVLVNDYRIINSFMERENISKEDKIDYKTLEKLRSKVIGLSKQGTSNINSKRLEAAIHKRIEENKEPTFKWLTGRINSLDWNLLDLFYMLCGFDHFKTIFRKAENGIDEAPICNLSMVSQYLSIFVDKYIGLITGELLNENKFIRQFFTSYLGALYRRSDGDFESKEELIPKGRISFLTIHQSKGLEFPVVVLGATPPPQANPGKVETIVRPFLKGEFEPIEDIPSFDRMRAYYVALSRAQNLLILPDLKGKGIKHHHPMADTIKKLQIPEICELDISTVPKSGLVKDDLTKVYSYTSDYLLYNDCPRKYMIYRKYGFVPARTTVGFFGNLVHETLDDLHNYLIDQRSGMNAEIR